MPTNAPPSVVPGSTPLPPLDSGRPHPDARRARRCQPAHGVFGFVARNIRWFVRGAVALGVVVLVAVVIAIRRRRARPIPAG